MILFKSKHSVRARLIYRIKRDVNIRIYKALSRRSSIQKRLSRVFRRRTISVDSASQTQIFLAYLKSLRLKSFPERLLTIEFALSLAQLKFPVNSVDGIL